MKKLLVAGCAVAVGVLVAEIGLRFAGVSYPNFYAPDPDRGAALRPHAEGWWTKEGRAYVRINGAGFRDRERAKAKPPRTFRVAVLGDSFAEAMQVPAERTFWSVAEQRLKNCPSLAGRDVEVLNFGVAGYGTAQELLTLRQRVWDYSPDLVLLAVFTGNDIGDNSRAVRREGGVPYFVRGEGGLVLDASFRETRRYRLRQTPLGRAWAAVRDRSRVLQLVNEARYAQQARALAAQAAAANSTGAAETGLSPEEMIYRAPDDPAWQDAWRVTEGLILLMRDEVRAKGARFLVVTLSTSVQAHPDPAARRKVMERLGVGILLYPDLRIKSLGEREGVEVLTLAPQLQAYAETSKTFLHGFDGAEDGHWNEEGHRVAGELIAHKLCEAQR